jgi:hypothetical protein
MINTDAIHAHYAPRIAAAKEASALAWEALLAAHVNGDDETILLAVHLEARAALQALRDALREEITAAEIAAHRARRA